MMTIERLPDIAFSVTSGRMAARAALEQLLTKLGPLNLEIEEAGTIELVLAEALNNVVEHAYPEGNPDGEIEIGCKHRADGLHICVTDSGLAMPDGETPIGKQQPVDVDIMDMPEGGFGWFLIKDLAKEVSYRRVGSKNELSLRLAVAVAPTD